jgi:HD superfamily phosphohydrolase
LFEPALGIDHEEWSCKILEDEQTDVHQVLKAHDVPIGQVVALIAKKNRERPPWQKSLLSSELDVDRLDYLRRDSYFTGSGYGHFDWYRILNSFALHTMDDGNPILVWPESAMYSIEEYIFSRFYMYNSVYQHKTTRGFEKLIQSAWKRANSLAEQGKDADLVREIAEFRSAESPSARQYLAMEDATLVYQMQVWSRHSDPVLKDLARRILHRNRMVCVDDPVPETIGANRHTIWEECLSQSVRDNGFDPEYYALRDDLSLTIYNPYIPEREDREQDPYNAIFIQRRTGEAPREISTILKRLGAVTGARERRYRYYVPQESASAVRSLAASQRW